MTQSQPGEMIERLTLSYINVVRSDGHVPPVTDWREVPPEGRDMGAKVIRAVLSALREPTPGMVDTGIDMLTERGCNPLSGDAEAIWQAMIDHILTEREG